MGFRVRQIQVGLQLSKPLAKCKLGRVTQPVHSYERESYYQTSGVIVRVIDDVYEAGTEQVLQK